MSLIPHLPKNAGARRAAGLREEARHHHGEQPAHEGHREDAIERADAVDAARRAEERDGERHAEGRARALDRLVDAARRGVALGGGEEFGEVLLGLANGLAQDLS